MAKDIKFELTSETKVNAWGIKLFRIKATVDIKEQGVKKGELGGWVESERLSNGNARVYGNAWVSGDARVYGNAQVYGNARVYGDAWVSGDAQVYGDARVGGNARVSLKRAYTKGTFLYSSDNEVKTTIVDQSKEHDFDNDEDYKYLLVVGDYEIKDLEEKPATSETIQIGEDTYEVTDELKDALKKLKKAD